MTFSRPDPIFPVPNPDCPAAADCTAHPAAPARPAFFISTHGFSDSIIASPATQRAFFLSTSVHAALGIILTPDGKPADHTSIARRPEVISGGGDFSGRSRTSEVGLDRQQRPAGVAGERAHVPLAEAWPVPPVSDEGGCAHEPPCGVGVRRPRTVP